MKLATLRNGTIDGQLAIVSTDLSRFTQASAIAPTLQDALDRWDEVSTPLSALSVKLNKGDISGKPFDASMTMSPLPRAYQWIDASAYMSHLERVRTAVGSKDAELQTARPIMYQGGSDTLLGAHDDIVVPDDELAVDFEAELAVILGPVSMGANAEEAEQAIRLITICNDVSLRRLVADDLQGGFGFFHAKPSSSFGPIVATPDEFGAAWDGKKLTGKLQSRVNGVLYGQPSTHIDMLFDFPQLIAEAARTRNLSAGTILGSGTVANTHDEILPIGSDGIGFSCIVEARTAEKAKNEKATTPFLKQSDKVAIRFLAEDGTFPIGEISQTVTVLED
ncbi:fumarylacetoacetate hydrolase family protein [Maritalea sp.]|uniref:fumarylacetoacetate hydrolase family protein n=1 Tax=Maritalea sp. TaxID=2003361 RepID=UPI003EF0C833